MSLVKKMGNAMAMVGLSAIIAGSNGCSVIGAAGGTVGGAVAGPVGMVYIACAEAAYNENEGKIFHFVLLPITVPMAVGVGCLAAPVTAGLGLYKGIEYGIELDKLVFDELMYAIKKEE